VRVASGGGGAHKTSLVAGIFGSFGALSSLGLFAAILLSLLMP